MKTSMKICVLAAAAAAALVGCSITPSKKEAARVEVGMTPEEVAGILGDPSRKSQNKANPKSVCLGYEVVIRRGVYANMTEIHQIRFVDGKVESTSGC